MRGRRAGVRGAKLWNRLGVLDSIIIAGGSNRSRGNFVDRGSLAGANETRTGFAGLVDLTPVHEFAFEIENGGFSSSSSSRSSLKPGLFDPCTLRTC